MVSPVTNFFCTAHRVYNHFSRDCGGKRIVAVARRKHIFYFKNAKQQQRRAGQLQFRRRRGKRCQVKRWLCQRYTCYQVRYILVWYLFICSFNFQEKRPRSHVLALSVRWHKQFRDKRNISRFASHVCFSFVSPRTLCCLGRSHATARTSGPGHCSSLCLSGILVAWLSPFASKAEKKRKKKKRRTLLFSTITAQCPW